MVTGRRSQRLAEEIREEVARMIASELKDPRLGFVTVTRVELTPDLCYARVHVGVLGSERERDKSLAALKSAAGFVRREIGRRMRIRHAPEIDFRYDKGLDATDRVAQLIREAGAHAGDGPAEKPEGVGPAGDPEPPEGERGGAGE